MLTLSFIRLLFCFCFKIYHLNNTSLSNYILNTWFIHFNVFLIDNYHLLNYWNQILKKVIANFTLIFFFILIFSWNFAAKKESLLLTCEERNRTKNFLTANDGVETRWKKNPRTSRNLAYSRRRFETKCRSKKQATSFPL